ncbi:MAG TPA: hypothetical protein VIV40_29875 [Kofleriaceae bacterium]
MRLAWMTAALAFALPSLASARPITAGASLGRIQSKANAEGEASDTFQLFGRIGFTQRLGAQLELQKIEDPDLDVRSGTALLVVELANNPHWAPILVAGMGIDHASNDWYEASGTHIEGGLGLEYRADGGLTIGADVRLGGRSVTEQTEVYPALEGDVVYFAPYSYGLVEGEYRSARLYAAIRF